MNWKSDEFWEFGHKNHGKQSLESKIWLSKLLGQNSLLGGSGAFLELFWSDWRVFGTKDMALVKFGNFLGFVWIFIVFGVVQDLFVNIFWKPRALLWILQTLGDHGTIYNKSRGSA
jgi:hypothetical protein